MKVKTTNALMKYLREQHNISIDGSKDKKNLRNIGYYHGYKGYRYIKNPKNRITLTSFEQNSPGNGGQTLGTRGVDISDRITPLRWGQITMLEV